MTLEAQLQAFNASPDLLAGKNIVISGASGGFGSSISLAASKLGATIILLGKNLRKLEGLYDEIEKQGGPQPAIFPINYEGATEADYENLHLTLSNEFGDIHGLVHAAAMLGQPAPFELQDVESWYQTLQVNLNARFLLTRACLPLMKSTTQAQVLFINDEKVNAYWGAYGVSGWACDGMMKMLAAEMEGGPIQVNTLHPGPTLTAMRIRAYPGAGSNDTLPPASAYDSLILMLLAGAHDFQGEIISYRPQ